MALKGPLWLLGRALVEERNRTPLGHLSARALDLGLRKTDFHPRPPLPGRWGRPEVS